MANDIRFSVFYEADPADDEEWMERERITDEAVGKPCSGSGFGMCEGLRDKEYRLSSAADAVRALKVLRSYPWFKRHTLREIGKPGAEGTQ